MAHHKSAKKRIKVSEKRRIRNKADLSKINTLFKKVHATEKKAEAEIILKEAVSFIDKTVSKGKVHKNNGARKKSQLTRYVNSLKD